MLFFPSATVVFSQNAIAQMAAASAAGNRESGGLLLGRRIFRSFYIVAVTVPSGSEDGSLTEFTLDGRLHRQYAAERSRNFQIPPRILGAWHSHICDGAFFSEQDRHANRILARAIHGALAVVAAPPGLEPALSAAYVTYSGHHRECRILIDHLERVIPKCLTQLRKGFSSHE